MEELGLMPSSTAAPSGARTGYKMSHYIVAGGAFERAFEAMPASCQLPWMCSIDEDAIGGKGKGKEKEAKRKLKLKYSCPGCELNVWGKAGLHLRCDDCGKELVVADAETGAAADERTATIQLAA